MGLRGAEAGGEAGDLRCTQRVRRKRERGGGAHHEHCAHVRDAGRVEAQRLVEALIVLPRGSQAGHTTTGCALREVGGRREGGRARGGERGTIENFRGLDVILSLPRSGTGQNPYTAKPHTDERVPGGVYGILFTGIFPSEQYMEIHQHPTRIRDYRKVLYYRKYTEARSHSPRTAMYTVPRPHHSSPLHPSLPVAVVYGHTSSRHKALRAPATHWHR